jgi:para-aminobenzoate synthetase/4-amino-4-deoxychorismate lyase
MPWTLPAAACAILEDRLATQSRARIFHNASEIIECSDVDGVVPALERLEAAVGNGFHAVGYLSYELGYAFEPKLSRIIPERRNMPLMWFAVCEPPLCIRAKSLDEFFAQLGPPPPIACLRAAADQEAHAEKLRRVLEYIEAGDIYQANITFPMRFAYDGDPLKLYAALRVLQPVSHGGFLRMADKTLLSVSPELWIDIDGHHATMRPMKGTVARGANALADEAAKTALLADAKQLAENLMIVDLLRNDFSRIAEIGTVRVPALFTLETYPGFHALTSTIAAQIKPGITLRQMIEALFPCGSIVGVPKIRAREIIRELEPQARDVYTGSIGAISPGGKMRFNVAIRTVVLGADGEASLGVGGGIVADSDPAAEYQEARLKARFLDGLQENYQLIETFRLSAAHGLVRIKLHMDRLEHSALKLGFVFDRAGAEAELATLPATSVDLRVRLTLARDGTLKIETQPLATPSKGILRVMIAKKRLDPGDPFLRHKTTRRDLYESAFAQATETGFDEAIFLNRRGEIAEACRSTVFIETQNGLATPDLESGVLPGVLRQSLIESGQAYTKTLFLGDLRETKKFFLGSSLRGLRGAVLIE